MLYKGSNDYNYCKWWLIIFRNFYEILLKRKGNWTHSYSKETLQSDNLLKHAKIDKKKVCAIVYLHNFAHNMFKHLYPLFQWISKELLTIIPRHLKIFIKIFHLLKIMTMLFTYNQEVNHLTSNLTGTYMHKRVRMWKRFKKC